MTIDDYDYAGNLVSLRRKGADGWETEIACQYDAMRRRIVWKNSQGGAYRSGTFKYNMLKYCERQNIQNGDYMFRSHDYRHGIAILFYEEGVSLQGVRDYLGHAYEEMTQQYVDYMPEKIAEANDAYFIRNNRLAASLKKGDEG